MSVVQVGLEVRLGIEARSASGVQLGFEAQPGVEEAAFARFQR